LLIYGQNLEPNIFMYNILLVMLGIVKKVKKDEKKACKLAQVVLY